MDVQSIIKYEIQKRKAYILSFCFKLNWNFIRTNIRSSSTPLKSYTFPFFFCLFREILRSIALKPFGTVQFSLVIGFIKIQQVKLGRNVIWVNDYSTLNSNLYPSPFSGRGEQENWKFNVSSTCGKRVNRLLIWHYPISVEISFWDAGYIAKIERTLIVGTYKGFSIYWRCLRRLFSLSVSYIFIRLCGKYLQISKLYGFTPQGINYKITSTEYKLDT